MPGSVSDSYDPEFGTAEESDEYRKRVDDLRKRIKSRLWFALSEEDMKVLADVFERAIDTI